MEEGSSTASKVEKQKNILNLDPADVSEALNRVEEGYKSYYGPASSNSIGCLLANKASNKPFRAGWVKCKVGGQRKEYYVHHLALIPAGRGGELRGLLKKKQVSHLCHQRTCFNASHLIVEDRKTNQDRTKCRGWTWIKAPKGKHKFNPCQHHPQCILPQ